MRFQLARVELSEEEEGGLRPETLGPDYEWEGVVVIYCGIYDKEVPEYGNGLCKDRTLGAGIKVRLRLKLILYAFTTLSTIARDDKFQAHC